MGLKKYLVKTAIPQDIEAEEIFLDAEAIRSLEDKGKLEKPIKKRNFIIFYGLILALFAALLLRAGYLQLIKGGYYKGLAEGNRLKIYPLAAPRGIIYDSLGEPLVYNAPSFDLTVNLADFLANPVPVQERILEKIAEAIIKKDEVEKNSFSRDNLVEVFSRKINEAKGKTAQINLIEDLERESALILESLVNNWPGPSGEQSSYEAGVRLVLNIRRQYVLDQAGEPAFSHILGYTGEPGPADLDENKANGFQFDKNIGKSGLELFYENPLRGEPGQEQVEVDALGRSKKSLSLKPAQVGNGLVLFINRGFQEKLYQSLKKMTSQLKVKKAAGLALDPRNGGILAMVSLPSFDNNLFSRKMKEEEYGTLLANPDKPLFNRAAAGQYPPGSTIKPFIAAAALEEKIIEPWEKINDQNGELVIVNEYNPQIVYRFGDWKIHGLTDMVKAIAESCNVYFYTIGGGYGQKEGLGIDRIKEYLRLFGLGELTGIDLPYEEKGLIPDKEWKEKTKGEKWYIGDTYHASIGQGDISVTPLQLAMAAAALSNNGVLYQPQLVDKIIDSEKNVITDIQPEIVRENFISQKNLSVVLQGMREAVAAGSARALESLPVEAAGKTGTAQFNETAETHAWFAGFAPAKNPEIVLVVLIEEGGEGHSAAVPVAKEVLEWYFKQDK
ncbi:MAG: penicillin-binding protein 2 [Candidatus Portnoybacteria bacterium RIFCSPLOWO2_12_FULL_39_9]|uniref:Penicillin-binding protein 2 n=1 Tax=Candidatus Portnoybacteria bacterium RIFCSPHIGHO2_12_FULL_38_9 TaxID=1801997 RepID=A0A1G2FET0_9BACT|nr:MAG: penicillin-binding protein 2 [Candidatus Portnoybacteria bacterium RIFCSPHIGHO2_02_FULL_39_12]OGZ36307.1 MAG: penicillin-binding protein 2 [Candidatus Portnoybacteria bacterium RIFCSPHIGHO2_12_FULL_38_9]OGZ37855.1 MAG: penicillin-binding protein 2 [Candidatus Portnoybacteria bacterium RIFCSPLOWO2_01_FULL_38_39]OGZ40771.1 MAG: penicillin-binding protein 2 [Candidatus Portnoybacteria bacterium RIFCSPLOWO2_12_FULL_39_9]